MFFIPFSKITKKIIVPVLTLALIILIPSGISKAAFSDVPSTHPQAKPIEELSRLKIINGYSDHTFKPEKNITKGDFLQMIFKDIGFKPSTKTSLSNFKDIPSDSPLNMYVQKAVELGIVPNSSVSENFYPLQSINHINALRIAFMLEGVPAPYYNDIDPQDLFEDIRPTTSFAYLVRAAKKNHIISVKNPQLFFPFKGLTRGDAAELIYQVQQLRQKNEDGTGLTVEIIQPNAPKNDLGTDELSNKFLNNEKLPILLDVWKKVHTDFYGKNNVNENDLVYGAIKGMIDKLNDHYTTYSEPMKAAELTSFLQGEFEGIGATLDLIDGHIVIVNTLTNSPAEKAGLQAGDIIIKIGDKSTSNLTLENTLDLIRGKAGTTVHLSISRNNFTLEFDVARARITLASVTAKLVSNSIGYIKIDQFLMSSGNEFKNAVNKVLELTNNNPKGFIIDLRGNPGGYLDVAVDILGHFVGDTKVLTSTKNSSGSQNFYTSTGKGELAKYPVIVLINAGSASASEIMAGALQDYKVAKLLGEKSFGKGSVQELLKYMDGSILKMTIAHWLTPLGRDISSIGLIPEIAVTKSKDDVLAGKDPQLDRAVQELNMGN